MSNYTMLSKCYREIMKQRGHFEKQVSLLDFIFKRKKISKNKRILDAACGPGDVVLELYIKGFNQLAALDGSKDMLDQLTVKAPPFSVEYCDWKFLSRYFDEKGQFDIIYILGHSLPHLKIEIIPETFQMIHEGLNDGGLFIFDIRPWEYTVDGKLKQPHRVPGVYRLLGIVHIDGNEYWIEEKVSYTKNYQKVLYRFTNVDNNAAYIEEELRYSIFDHLQAQEWLQMAGYAKNKIETLQHPSWPHLVIVCEKG